MASFQGQPPRPPPRYRSGVNPPAMLPQGGGDSSRVFNSCATSTGHDEDEVDAAASLLRHCAEANNVSKLLEVLEYTRSRSDSSGQFLVDVVKRSEAVLLASHCGYDTVLVNLLCVGDLANYGAESGETPLYLACAAGHLTTVRRLIDLGATCDPGPVGNGARAQNLFSAWSPHRVSCCKGHVQIFNLLETEFTSDWTIEETNRFFALAITSNSIDMVKKFISTMDVNKALQIDENFESPLEIALGAKCVDVAAFLISSGADFSADAMSTYPDVSSELLRRFVRCYRENGAAGQEQETYDVCWLRLHLHALDVSTLMDFYDRDLNSVDISQNHITELPSAIPWNLTHIRSFNASSNEISRLYWPCIPGGLIRESLSLCKRLTVIDLSKNQLTSIPGVLFMLPYLEILNLSHNKLSLLCSEDDVDNFRMENDESSRFATSETCWKCVGLRSLDVSYNELEELPKHLRAATALEKLEACNNHMRKFPPSWQSPLSELNLNHNWLSTSPVISASTWESTLTILSLSGNRLENVHLSIFQLEYLRKLDLSFNRIAFLPPADQWKMASLMQMDLSHNRLLATVSSKSVTVLEFPSCLHQRLIKLNIGFNRLTSLPLSVTHLKSLEELDISGNISLKELPHEISNMRSLWLIELNGLRLRNLPPSLWSAPTKSILEYYGEQYTDAVPSHRLKVVLVGNKGHGKTSLAYALRKKKPPADLNFGKVEVMPWRIEAKGMDPPIDISLWDLPGDIETANLAQCFMTPNALYIVVCNLLTLDSGSTGLDEWLRNIQSGAPDSYVVIAGTYADALKESERQAAEERLKMAVNNLCRARDENDLSYIRSCYPRQSNMYHLSVVTCSAKEPQLKKAIVGTLRDRIRNVALEMKTVGQNQNLIKRKVPRVYAQLCEAIKQEASLRSAEPFLTTREFQELVQKHSNSIQIDASLAAQYLHEIGVLLHFPNHLRGLNELYFISPAWLYSVLAKILILTTTSVLSMKEAQEMFLKDANMTSEMFGKYLELLEKFEIVLCMDHSEPARLLMPYKLPSKPSIEIGEEQHGMGRLVVRRQYQLPYVPVSFWSRLIVRTLNGLRRLSSWQQNKRGSGSYSICSTEGFAVSHRREVMYWNSGLRLVDVATGCSFVAETVKELPNVICLSVHSERGDYGAMGFLVDQVNAVIEEWYPELLREFSASNQRECSTIEAVCPGHFAADSGVHQPCPGGVRFTVEKCVLALMERRMSVTCPAHPDMPVLLSLLVPDLLMADLPRRCKLIPEMIRPDFAKPLGKGGQAAVYEGQYGKMAVACKLCYRVSASDMTLSQAYTGSSSDSGVCSVGPTSCHRDSIADELMAKNNLSAITAVRQETFMLLSLQHPCLLKLVGVSLWTCAEFAPCTALELAPLGDLRSVLNDALDIGSSAKHRKLAQPTWKRPPLGRVLTYRILCQVANALRYLHAADIVYRDLKSDNVLVWSLSGFDGDANGRSGDSDTQHSFINVKLSDYGLSRIVTSQGTRGNEGTPAYQAPEVIPGLAYNEKVDIFSLGMFAYELLSGRRPFSDMLTNLLTREAIQRGDRPCLHDAPHRVYVDMHCLVQLMPHLWHADQRLRPSATELVAQLHSISFYSLSHCVPHLPARLPDQPPLITWPDAACYYQQGNRDELWLWNGSDDDRRLHMFDPDLGLFTTGATGVNVPGRSVCGTLVVDDQIFLAHENGIIEILTSLADDRPLMLGVQGSPTFLFYHKALEISSSLPEGSNELVYCGLTCGTVCVLRRSLESASRWGCVSRIVLRQFERVCNEEAPHISHNRNNDRSSDAARRPATCMCKVAEGDSGEELWVGYGNSLCVIGSLADMVGGRVVDQVSVVSWRAQIRRARPSVVSGLCAYGGSVFATVRHCNRVYQLNAKLRVMEHTIAVSSEIGVGAVIATSNDVYGSFKSGSGRVNTPDARICDVHSTEHSRTTCHVTSAAIVKDTLWLGLSNGDILIVAVNSEGGHGFRYRYGEIMATLRPPNEDVLIDPVILTSESQKRIICLYAAGAVTNGHHPTKICVWEPLGSENITSLIDWWPRLIAN